MGRTGGDTSDLATRGHRGLVREQPVPGGQALMVVAMVSMATAHEGPCLTVLRPLTRGSEAGQPGAGQLPLRKGRELMSTDTTPPQILSLSYFSLI